MSSQLDTTKSFENWGEYDNFLQSIEESEKWKKTKYHSEDVNVGLIKQYFKNLQTGEVWELTEPDPPFRGSWIKVSQP